MKKVLTLCSALVIPILYASDAHAEVTLYGKIETAVHIEKQRGGDTLVNMDDQGSRVGLNIVEDLTGKWKVKGYLEIGFNSDNGTYNQTTGNKPGTTLFGRRSILAVANEDYDELGMGRMGSVRSTISPYSLVMAWIDPMETAYGDIASIGNVWGNDPRSNNCVTYVTPRINGFKLGATWSFATTDDDNHPAHENNRMLSLGGNWQNKIFGVYAGFTNMWWGHDNGKSTDWVDNGKKYTRANSQAYTLGATWKATDALKLYIGGQYMKNWRNASGWNLDSIKTTVDGVAYTDADRKYGIDAWNTIIGFRYHPDAHWRFVLDYVSLFGHHKMADSQKLKASRQNINGAIEYKITKRTMAYIHSSYSIGRKQLNTPKVNTWVSHVGLQHWF